MTKKTYRGVHGTCVSQAKSIARNGIRASSAGRAGAGAYLWSYVSDPAEAILLAEDWYRDQLDEGRYDKEPEKGMAVLFFELELLPLEFISINTTAHHEMIRGKLARGRGKIDLSKAYDDHIAGLAAHRKQAGADLKLVETAVPYPKSTKARLGGVPLTPGADAYIVLHQGLSDLKLFDARGLNLKSL